MPVLNVLRAVVRDVQLLVEVPVVAMAFASVPPARKLPSMPKWPTPADKHMPQPPITWDDEFHDAGQLCSPDGGTVEYRSGTVEVTFTVGDMRPGQRYATSPVTLIVGEPAPVELQVSMTVRE